MEPFGLLEVVNEIMSQDDVSALLPVEPVRLLQQSLVKLRSRYESITYQLFTAKFLVDFNGVSQQLTRDADL